MIRQLTATSEHAGVRLDAFLSADGQLSRSQAARLIEEGHVAVDGRPAAKSCRVAEGQQVTVDIPEVKDTAVEAQDIPLDDTLCLALLPYFLAAQLLSDTPVFYLLNSYTTGYQPAVIENILRRAVMARHGGHVQAQG